jgi:ribonuclease HII
MHRLSTNQDPAMTKKIHPTTNLLAGVDEAGRGPLAGPVVACAVILDPQHPICGLKDSKKLSHTQRTQLYNIITQHSLAYAIGTASVEEIDQINILQATLLAMQRAVTSLELAPTEVWIDGNAKPALHYPCQCIIKGDQLIPAISAASIVAKVHRDHMMLELDQLYPQYGFAQHKAYGTKQHLAAIIKHGPCPAHRKTFAPIKHMLKEPS